MPTTGGHVTAPLLGAGGHGDFIRACLAGTQGLWWGVDSPEPQRSWPFHWGAAVPAEPGSAFRWPATSRQSEGGGSLPPPSRRWAHRKNPAVLAHHTVANPNPSPVCHRGGSSSSWVLGSDVVDGLYRRRRLVDSPSSSQKLWHRRRSWCNPVCQTTTPAAALMT